MLKVSFTEIFKNLPQNLQIGQPNYKLPLRVLGNTNQSFLSWNFSLALFTRKENKLFGCALEALKEKLSLSMKGSTEIRKAKKDSSMAHDDFYLLCRHQVLMIRSNQNKIHLVASFNSILRPVRTVRIGSERFKTVNFVLSTPERHISRHSSY